MGNLLANSRALRGGDTQNSRDEGSKGRYFSQGTALNRFFDQAPYLSRCSDNKTATNIRPREYAIRYPYMQANRPGMVSWLIFDLDHSNSMVWDDEGFPAPNMVVRNRKNGHAHLFYAIPPVCTTENGRSKPIAYMKAVYEAMAMRLSADPSYSGPVAKTPGHPWWNTWEIHSAVYDLGELAEYVELESRPPWSKGPDLESVSHSRHCLLFEELRFFSYSIVSKAREEGSYRSFYRAVEAYAYNRNSFKQRGFSEDLSISQVRATVKSVARWTWDKYTGTSRCHRGVMGLDSSLPLNLRQRLAAERTHKSRKSGTEARIRSAARNLLKSGEKLTQKAVALAARLTRQTVAKYLQIIEEIKSEATNVATLEVCKRPSANVNYAAHQIPACSKGLVGVSTVGAVGGDLERIRSLKCEPSGANAVAEDHQTKGQAGAKLPIPPF